MTSFEASEYIPLEYYDSDVEELEVQVHDNQDIKLCEHMIQKIFSIGGIRKLYYTFKCLRRDQFKQSNSQLDSSYISFCNRFLSQLEAQSVSNQANVFSKFGCDLTKFESLL